MRPNSSSTTRQAGGGRSPDTLEQQAELSIRRKRFPEAEQAINQALSIRPDSAYGHYLRAQVFRGLGREADYRQELNVAVEQNPLFMAARIELSQSFRTSKALTDAFSAIDAAPLSQKNEFPVLVERAWVLLAQRRYREAKPDIEKALSISREPLVLTQAGLLAIEENRPAEGRTLLEEALQKSPDNVEALNGVALSFASEKKVSAAVERVRKQATVVPNSAPVQLMLGAWLERSQDLAGARNAYAAALNANPSSRQALIANARMNMIQGRWEPARNQVDSVLRQDPRNVDALLALGMLEEGSGRPDAAIKAYRGVLEADPNHVVARNNLVFRLSESPVTADEALMLALQLKQAAPGNAEIDDTVGWVYYKKGSYDRAARYFADASTRSKNPRHLYHLAMAQLSGGNRSLGRKTLSAALEMNPNLPEANEARRLAGLAP